MVVLSIEVEGEPGEVALAIRKLLMAHTSAGEPATQSSSTSPVAARNPKTVAGDPGPLSDTAEHDPVQGEVRWTEAAAADYLKELNETAQSLVTALVRAPEENMYWMDLERDIPGLDQNVLLNTLRHMGHAARRIRSSHGQLFTNPVRNDRAGGRCTVDGSFAYHARGLVAQSAGATSPRPASRRSEAWGLTQ